MLEQAGSDPSSVAKTAAVLAGAGGSARIALALLGGERSWAVLLIHAFVGAVLGVIAGAFAIYLDSDLRSVGWPELTLAGFAGLAGALGTKSLDMIAEAARRKLGG